MRKMAIICVSGAILLAGCNKKADETVADNARMNNAAMNQAVSIDAAVSPDQTFVNTAAASDAFEIETSKLALATSASKPVKKFAQMMIDAHTASTAKLNTVAGSVIPALMPNPALTADQQSKVDMLKTAKGREFDTAYIAAQNEGHAQMLEKLKTYAAAGGQSSLKAFAAAAVPVVTAHLNAVRSLKP